VLASWVAWALLNRFIPFGYIAFVAGEIGLMSMSEIGGLAVGKLIRTISGKDAKKIE